MKCAIKTRLKSFLEIDKYKIVCGRRFSDNLSYMNRGFFILRTPGPFKIGFKLDNINKRLKIIQHQSIVDIFTLFDIFNNKFQNDNEG